MSVSAESLRLFTQNLAESDSVSMTVTFGGGSVGTLSYNTVGDDAPSKERLEVYGGGVVAPLDDFPELETAQNGSTSSTSAWNQDKGQAGEMERTVRSFREQSAAPIPFDQLVAGMQAVFATRESLRDGEPVEVSPVELEQARAE